MRAGGRVAEEQHELLLDVGGDRVLPAGRLRVDLLPLEPDHVDEQAFREPVAADDRGREAEALRGEAEPAVALELDEALVDEASDRLRDGRGGEPEPFHEARPHGHDALFFERQDRLEVLLGRIVQLGHDGQVTANPGPVGEESSACTRDGRVPTWVSTRLS